MPQKDEVLLSRLLHKLAGFRPFTALVFGDMMLDETLYGAAERLSPDAPVPVLHAARTERCLGGAANAACCLTALRGDVRCFGVVGDDVEGAELRKQCRQAGYDDEDVLVDPSRPTTVKRSFVGLAQHRHPQKMFRVDVESREPMSPALSAAILDRFAAALPDADVVCLEDCDKGLCSEELCRRLIAMCRDAKKPVIVDPAAIVDYGKYNGATAMIPNRSEAELVTGFSTPVDASEYHNAGVAAELARLLDLEAVVVTLDRHGALLQERGREPELVPTVARSVYDVTGAGDVVLAAIAAGRANGLTWSESVRFANAAAGLAVEAFGAQAIPFASVHREVVAQHRTVEGKVCTVDELLVDLAAHREAGRRIVFTNGAFDVIHAGHVAYIREAKKQGDVLVVAVNSDAQVRAQKGAERPVHPLERRLEVLAEFESIDYLVAFDEPTAHALLRAVQPDIFVKGGDYRPEEINEWDLVCESGLDLRVLAHRPGLSTSNAVEKLKNS